MIGVQFMKRKIVVVLLSIILVGVLWSASPATIEASIKPTITVEKAGDNVLKVSWIKKKEYSNYVVYRSRYCSGTYIMIKETTSSSYVDTGLNEGCTYFL